MQALPDNPPENGTDCWLARILRLPTPMCISTAATSGADNRPEATHGGCLRKEIDAALQPFYMGHMCLYVTPECFDDPPKTPEVYNDATACVWRDGTWQLLEDTSKGFLLFVQSKSKEEAAA